MAQRTGEVTVVLLGWILLGACAGSDGEVGDTGDTDAPPTLSKDLQPIFNRNCIGCHAGADPSSALVLSEGEAHANLVDVASVQVPSLARVAPGEPDASYLVAKLEDTHTAIGGSGTRMPPYLVLADTELRLFRDWIAAGAVE